MPHAKLSKTQILDFFKHTPPILFTFTKTVIPTFTALVN